MAVITNFGVPTSNSQSTLMSKLQYRFRVEFAGLGSNTDGLPLVTSNVISVTRPQLDHEDITLDTYNSKIRLAGKHTWSDITLVLRDDMDSNVIRALDHQLSKQVNHATQASAKAGADYKFKMTIIIVSHRINTLKFCDKVYSIENNTLKLVNKSKLN